MPSIFPPRRVGVKAVVTITAPAVTISTVLLKVVTATVVTATAFTPAAVTGGNQIRPVERGQRWKAPVVSLTAPSLPYGAAPDGTYDDFTYTPTEDSVALNGSVLFTPSYGDTPWYFSLTDPPWDAVEVPTLSEALVADAYIEVRPAGGSVPEGGEIEFLQGPWVSAASGGACPSTGTGLDINGNAWVGIGNKNTMNSRFGFGSFGALTEAIWYAGRTESTAYTDGDGRIIVSINGNVGYNSAGSIRIGGPTGTSSGAQVFWSANNDPFPQSSTPRDITGLWIIGKNAPAFGTSAQTATYTDTLPQMSLAQVGWGKNFNVLDITFQGLRLRNTQNGSDGVLTGIGGQAKFGLLRITNCKVEGDPSTGNFLPYGTKQGLRFYQTRGSYHLDNVHFGGVYEHCIYLDFINSGLTHQKSYFKDITMEEAGKSMIQLVSRRAEDPTGEGAQGLVICENMHAYNNFGTNSSVFTFVGLRSYDNFLEDGTIILRDCVHQEGPRNVAGSFCPPTLLLWEDGGTNKGVHHDSQGFHHTRLVVDNLTVQDVNGVVGILPNVSDSMCEITGCGDVQIYGFSLGNNSTRPIWEFDKDIHFHPFNGYTTSNNPPYNHDYGDGNGVRVKGTYKAFNGSVRFFIPNLETYSGWNGQSINKRIFVSNFINQNSTLNAGIMNAMVDTVGFPAGVTISGGTFKAPGTGIISGTATEKDPLWSDDFFLQNHFPLGYLRQPPRIEQTIYGVKAAGKNPSTVPSYTHIGLTVGAETVVNTSAPKVTLTANDREEFGFRVWTMTYVTIAATPTITVGVSRARWNIEHPEPFATGINVDEIDHYTTQILFKDHMARSEAFQYFGLGPPTGLIPPNPGDPDAWVPLTDKGWPDFASPLWNPAETSIITQIFSITGNKFPSGEYVIQWTGNANLSFYPNSAVGALVGTGVGYRRYEIEATNKLMVWIEPGIGGRAATTLTSLHVYGPGADPLNDETPGEDVLPLAKTRLHEVISTDGALRWYDATGVKYCEFGYWSNPQGQYGTEGQYAGTLYLKGWHSPLDGSWPHKDLDEPRHSHTFNPWYSGMARSGVAVQLMVKVCNDLQRDMWWNVPHDYQASQWTAACEYIRDNLDSNLKLYLEWSNEAWNSSFPVYYHVVSVLNGIGPLNPAWSTALALKFDLLFTDARAVFASEPSRLKACVMGWMPKKDYIQPILEKMTLVPDVIGCAGYLSHPAAEATYDANTTAGTIIADLEAAVEVYLRGFIRNHYSLAQQFNTEFWLYEAGQSIYAGGQWAAAATEAQIDPRMRSAYGKMKAMFAEEGVDGVLWYHFCSNNFAGGQGWGHLRWMDDPTNTGVSPKWDAIVVGSPVHVAVTVATITSTAQAIEGISGSLQPGAAAVVVVAVAPARIAYSIYLNPAAATVTCVAGQATHATRVDAAVLRALSPPITIGRWEPQLTGVSYALPDAAAPAHQVCNVFWDPGLTTPSWGRNVLITASGANFLPAAAATYFRIDSWEGRLIADGWTVVSLATTGVSGGEGLFNGFDTGLWDLWAWSYSQEKDLVTAIKWVRENLATVQGGSSSQVGMGGLGAVGMIAALMVQDEITFTAATSSTSLQSSIPDFCVLLNPIAWWAATVDTFSGLHFPKPGFPYVAAPTLADADPTALTNASPIYWWVQQPTSLASTPVFLASSRTAESTDFSLSSSLPTLDNTLTTINPAWHAHILWQHIRTDAYHSGKSEFWVDASEALDSPYNWQTGTFTDGMLGLAPEIQRWADESFVNRRAVSVATVTLGVKTPSVFVEKILDMGTLTTTPQIVCTLVQPTLIADTYLSVLQGTVTLSARSVGVGHGVTAARMLVKARPPAGVLYEGGVPKPVSAAVLSVTALLPSFESGQKTYDSRMSLSSAGAQRITMRGS